MSKAKKSTIRKYISHTILMIALAISVTVAAVFLQNTPVEALSGSGYDSCVDGLTYKGSPVDGRSVLSIQRACQLCGTSSTSARGVLWFNDSSDSPSGNTIRIDSWSADEIQVHLWGAVFSCGSTSRNDNWGRWLWIGLPGQMKGQGTSIEQMEGAADFFDFSKGFYGDSIYQAVCRGRLPGAAYSWSNIDESCTTWPTGAAYGLGLPNVVVFYPKKFKEAAEAAGGCSAINEGGTPRLECKMQVSVNRCFDNTYGMYKNVTNSDAPGNKCYGDPSEIILNAPPYIEDGFSSKSKVTDAANASNTSASVDWDQNAAEIQVEADSSTDTATVNFTHKLRYKPESAGGSYGDATTDWEITIDDGSGGTPTSFSTGSFATPGGVESQYPDDVNWISPEAAVTVTLAASETSRTVCSTITYSPKTVEWDASVPRNMSNYPNTDPSNTGSTKACAKVVRSVTTKVGEIEFWSQSHVNSVAEKDVFYYGVETIEKTIGDEASLYLSTDWPSAKADFWHKISYEMTGFTIDSKDTISYDNMCTTWSIESNTSTNGDSGTYCASSYYTGEQTVSTTGPSHITISIGSAGSEASAYEKIKYAAKKIPIYRERKVRNKGTALHPVYEYYWHYFAKASTGTEQGDSKASITYARPNEPTGDGPSSDGASEDGPMYAGEQHNMYWQAEAIPIQTRRIISYQSIAFLTPVSKVKDGVSVQGNYKDPIPAPGASYPYRNNEAPCTFWSNTSRLGAFRTGSGVAAPGCAQVDPASTSLNQTFPDGTYTPSDVKINNVGRTMAIPDWVGDKYCNSFGYQWAYYVGKKNLKGSNAGNIRWEATGQQYWTHYNAACRTIAKKPSVALWNGGLFVDRKNVSTSTSPRRYASDLEAGPNVASLASGSMTLSRFGSWSEYLANVNGSVDGDIPGMILGTGGVFSSGAAYAWHGSPKENDALKNSPLTIANESDPPGNSGVLSNTALMDRLDAYFKKAATDNGNSIGPLTVTGNGDSTKIYYVNGDVSINGNITINTTATSAKTIYDIPQVVIFATGNINIAQGVEQIDAWLISKDGKVNTCYSSFTPDQTQASVNNNPITANNTCQKKLIINGPVLANSVTLQRSYGSDGTSNDDRDAPNAENKRAVPAEVFNLSAENYLWAYAHAGRYSSSYTEAYSRELPPRY